VYLPTLPGSFMLITKFLYLIFSFSCGRTDPATCKLILKQFGKSLVNKRNFRSKNLVDQFIRMGMVLEVVRDQFSVTKNKNFIKGHTVVIGKKTRE
jgi:hypothetical protein